MPERPIAYILGTFPQASQTFIAREVRGLRDAGLPLLVFALGRRSPDVLEEADRAWYPDVRFTPVFLAPAVLAANAWFALRAPGRYARTFGTLISLPYRPRVLVLRAVALFMRAAWIARTIARAGGCRQVHAHFALAQAEVAMAVAGLLGVPFSFTAHARDIYATPSALEEKMRAARTVVTCTAYNVEHLRGLCPELSPSRVQLVHHGVDVDAASRVAEQRLSDAGATPVILAAGRLIDKKGFDTLIDACAVLRSRGRTFTCRIFGTGPLMAELRRRADAAGLGASVDLPGWARAGRLLEEMGRATVFAMPSRVAAGGDRDGIPNVVLEAMAAGLPVVATGVSGIPEAVSHDVTGLLVEPDSPSSLATALERVLTDAGLAGRFGAAGRARIAEEFTLAVASQRLRALFQPPG